jgi:SSS family solute:Na+ symporter
MIASLMAALMSTADMMMLTCSGLITHSVYRPVRPGKSENHYVQIGRFFGAMIVVGAALIVMRSDDLFNQLKFFWEWGVVFSAGFWMGILWRRANRKSVWYSILLTMLLFFLLPLLMPTVFPDLRTNKFFLKETQPRVVERTYTARQQDIEERNIEIKEWSGLPEHLKSELPKPKPLKYDETFTKKYKLPQKSIFWTQGIKVNDEGVKKGYGMISFELVLLSKVGIKLEDLPYALNETIRIMIRTIFPFLIIVLFSFIYKHTPEEKKNLDYFYAKMKTKVQDNKEKDKEEVEKSYRSPDRFNHKRMFPSTQWEILKWNREDGIGFIVAVLMVGVILGFLFFVVNLGGKIG